ncbi:adenylate/guanylate cyclase domain-containing protein [Lichenifustis flavocetrariae]|uniref:Adenylate/guanylate cyclase domain-containing protein n=1 Tax=Lichenifustis flavocetrariae TaxID=2949735 RepID=A0AA41ZB04_9HYPH|nr:adenylate/guanylate cyclase domain-containing protein [Lichenifustis flavocetrariae]MCW6512582.1 adenylate/guanylate cyclase domain-containing protein [Lichenifustis flavocetrariae]
MRIGIRPALIIFVVATFATTGGVVDLLWWRTAQSNSRMLATKLNQQIASEVKRELASLIGSAEAAHGAIRTIFVQDVITTRQADKREFVFLAQLQAQPAVSWIAFGWPDDSFFAAHKLGDGELEMMEIAAAPVPRQRRIDRYKVLTGDIEFEKRAFKATKYDVTAQAWYKEATEANAPLWIEVTQYPGAGRPAIAYAGAIDVDRARQGVLAVMIDLDRLSRFLASLPVGKSGAAFVLRPNGLAVAVPDAEADEVHGTMVKNPTLLAVARQTHDMMLAKADAEQKQLAEARVEHDGIPYTVTVTPLDFMGWEVTTVVPEADFLGAIDSTNQHVSAALVVLILSAVGAAMLLARSFLVRPLTRIAAELGRIQRFELEQIEYHPSRLRELDLLSKVASSMASGLSAFRKYLPGDLVNKLLAEGIEAKPGGTVQPLTVLFADIAGFAGMSERLGDAIVPLLSAYIDVISAEIVAQGGTIDKFIGDAIMAFWGAPAANADHAADACRAALACSAALARAGIADDGGRPLVVRIGINTGNVLVGNIGSQSRLNYTAIGDAVNVASRIEGANKVYGTTIMIGDATRLKAGASFQVRELDRVAVYGRAEGMPLFEIVGTAEPGASTPAWILTYAEALELYRTRRFEAAVLAFERVVAMRGCDAPSRVMIERCQAFLVSPPNSEWHGTMVFEQKD